ncbi:MAG: hypothetical protein U1E13_01675 [Methylophilaceae bacterium]|nr:hypothetical protein [Methylophilaceae bacterium]
MSTEQISLLAIILSSSLISAVVSALVAGFFALRAKKYDYVHHYYKMILDKRIAAYEQLDILIDSIKIAVLDDDGQPYHWCFSSQENFDFFHRTLFNVMAHGLWQSDDIFSKIRGINILLLNIDKSIEGLLEFGKQNYSDIASLREGIEKSRAIDMLNLHDVERFLKNKKKVISGFSPVEINR